MSIESPLIQRQRQEMIAKRIKETKELEREYSKEICQLKREYEEQKERQKEYMEVIETYKMLVSEIEELKQKRNEVIAAREKAEIDMENERIYLEKYNEEMKQKKIQFDIFMKQKGKEAFEYLRKMKETKDKLEEEIHRYQKKKQTKEIADENSKQIVEYYRQKEMEERLKWQNQPESTTDVLYKIAAPYHNNGNKIDYSTTNFHNVVVSKHKDMNDPYLNVTAFDKAKDESEQNIKRRAEKEKKIKDFNKQTEANYKEIIRQKRAKENLDRLNEEMKKMALAKMKCKNKSNKVNMDQNLANANSLNKKSDFLMNKLLSQQGKNLKKILNPNEANLVDPNEISNADENSLHEFYKDDSDVEEKGDEILYKRLPEDDEKENEPIKNYKFYYHEPIERDTKPIKQKISRASPVDLPSYQRSEYQEEVNVIHREPKVTIVSQVKNSMRAEQEAAIENSSMIDSSTFSVLDILNLSKKPGAKSSLDQSKGKKNISVTKFSSLGNKKNTGGFLNIGAEIEKSEKRDEEKERRKAEYALNLEKEIKKQNEKNEIPLKENEKTEEKRPQINPFGSKNILNKGKGMDIAPIMENPEEENVKEEKKKVSKDSKWRMNKQELFERKQKMLKDKSNINKVALPA
ncbi:MAG: hypothetical protein MJ252_04915 [archaeon]|nr:hypothetical protein [archaeon]